MFHWLLNVKWIVSKPELFKFFPPCKNPYPGFKAFLPFQTQFQNFSYRNLIWNLLHYSKWSQKENVVNLTFMFRTAAPLQPNGWFILHVEKFGPCSYSYVNSVGFWNSADQKLPSPITVQQQVEYARHQGEVYEAWKRVCGHHSCLLNEIVSSCRACKSNIESVDSLNNWLLKSVFL